VSPVNRVTATTLVAVDPATAFQVFTDEVDLWWKHGMRYRPGMGAGGAMRFEPGKGGRLLEVYEPGSADPFELGRVTVWEPARRLVFEMRGRDFRPGETTQVEIRFEAEGRGTRVTVEHRGWDSFPDDHPVRHGMVGDAFNSMMALWWGDLLVAARDHLKRTRAG
jgi:uncharacterized protein YndB with AHSA1/START domain